MNQNQANCPEAKGEAIRMRAEGWHVLCEELPSYKALSRDAKKNFGDIALFFAQMMYSEHDQAPNQWTAAAMQELLTKTYPESVLSPPSYFVALGAILPVLLEHLEQAGEINERKAAALKNRLGTAVPTMLRKVNARSNELPNALAKAQKNAAIKAQTKARTKPKTQPDTPNDTIITLKGKAATDLMKRTIDSLLSAPAYTNTAEAYMANLEAIKPKDETPATLEQWQQLYEVTQNIRMLKPWEYLHESERFTLLLPERDEPVYIVVMGSGEMTYGIGIYPGYDSLRRLLEMTENEAREDDFTIAFEQHCINLYFGDRDELEPEDTDIIKKLGLKFRDQNEWPYFRSMKPSYIPWFLDFNEAELTIAALQNFAMAFIAYLKQGFEIDFEDGQTLLRLYDSESDMWYNTVAKLPLAPFIVPKLMVTDDTLIAKLKKKKKTQAKLGFVLTYVPMPIQENDGERPRVPRMAMLIDLSIGKPFGQVMDVEHEIFTKAIMDMLTDYVEQKGRPAAICVQDEDTGCYVEDFATKLDIKLMEDVNLNLLDDMMMGLMQMMESGGLYELLRDDIVDFPAPSRS